MSTYDVTIEPSGTRFRGMIYDWRVTATRLSDNCTISKLTVTRWGARRWSRKENLDQLFAEYVDGGRFLV